MRKDSFVIRASKSDIQLWKAHADESDMSLSAWIRFRCNEPVVLVHSDSVIKLDQPPVMSRIIERKACKHGLLFCKTCK